MADRLHQELLAVAGLEHVSALQLHELPWKSREQIFISLFQEHASSVTVADELRAKSRDRRLERKTEKSENAERDSMRKNEERFRSEFMQIAATELSRLGAPTMITWQKLVFDRDCCTQAFRILLTKIKSSRRSSNNSTVRKPIMLAKRFNQNNPEDDDEGSVDIAPLSESSPVRSYRDNNGDATEPSEGVVLPRLGPSSVSKTSAPQRRFRKATPEWNSDTGVADGPTGRSEDERPEDEYTAASGISIQRTKPKTAISSATSAFAAKLKKSQLQSLQHENATLVDENATLKKEITYLEELVETLQGQNAAIASGESSQPTAVHHARMKLLQAQNLQLQRQVALLESTFRERELAEGMLLTSLSSWRHIVEAGREEAKAAGAEDTAKTKDGKPATWMMAIPERLLDELRQIENQIDHAKKTASIAMEAKLRIGTCAAEFLKQPTPSVSFSDIYVPGIAHLRVDRVKKLEAALVNAERLADMLHDTITASCFPRLQERGNTESDEGRHPDSMSRQIDELMHALRNVTMEVGAFGVVLPRASAHRRQHADSETELITAAHVQRAYTATAGSSNGMSAKDREKQLKTMLKQLQASESEMLRERTQLLKEACYWKNAWMMQEELLHALITRVKSVGDNRMEWAESQLVSPLIEVQEVWASFQKTQLQQDGRIHRNAYLPLLIDTLQRHEPVLCLEAIEQWRAYAARYNQEVSEILADYEANCNVLRSISSKRDPPV